MVKKYNVISKALCLWLLVACQNSTPITQEMEEDNDFNPMPPIIKGVGNQWAAYQCMAGEGMEIRYFSDSKNELEIRFRGQTERLRHHVNRDLIIYEGKQLALYSDGEVHQIAYARTGQLFAKGCH